ncbi:MAG: HAD family hydrolase [Pseudomonadota bacterium]
MILRYRCLILDHDDTVVKSTPDIHYPSFVEAMKVLRPDTEPLTLEQFVSYCFNPGFGELCRDILKFSDEEQEYQYKVWKKSTDKIPDFYSGFPELITDYKKAGGIIAVVSHSERDIIARDYMLKCSLVPDMIFGWDQEEHKRKPSPYPVLEIMKGFGLKNDEILVVDDLKPGLDMARSCRVAFAGAGWSHVIPEIKEYMRLNADFYFTTVDELRKFVFSE